MIILIWICTSRNLYSLDEESLAELVTCFHKGLWAIPEKIQTGDKGLRT